MKTCSDLLFTFGKRAELTIALSVLAVTSAQADSYETYAFGDTETAACESVKSDLKDQAILQCRMKGGSLDKAEFGACGKTGVSRGRHKVTGSVEFSCKKD